MLEIKIISMTDYLVVYKMSENSGKIAIAINQSSRKQIILTFEKLEPVNV